MKPDPFTPLTGRCRCEQVRFQMEAAPLITHCCHCRACQRFTGAAFRTVALIETEHLTLLEGETRLFPGPGGEGQVECAECGSILWTHRPDLGAALAFVSVGLLDHSERLPPEAHYFTRFKQPWVALPPEVPAFEERGDPGKAGVRERLMTVLAEGA